jgi:hypothetical protein
MCFKFDIYRTRLKQIARKFIPSEVTVHFAYLIRLITLSIIQIDPVFIDQPGVLGATLTVTHQFHAAPPA